MLLKNKNRFQNTLLFATILLFGIIYTVIVVSNHYLFRTYALDYGFYNQAFWDFAHLRVSPNTVFEPILGNFFEVHPAFTVMILSPFYWLFGWIFGTYTLLIVQNLFVILGAYGTYLFVKSRTNNFWLGYLALIHYFVLWAHFSALSADYIDTTVAASVVPLFLYFFDKRKYVYSTLCFLFIIITKENLPIWFIFISIFLIIIYWKEKPRVYISIAYVFASLVYLLMLFKFIIPAFENKNLHYWGFAYSALGNNPLEAIMFMLKHPIKTFEMCFINPTPDHTFDGMKVEFYYVFLISGGLILFFKPKYLLMFIPVIAQKVLNDSYLRWGIYSFYSIEIASILSLAIYVIISDFKNIKYSYIVGIIVCLLTAITTVSLFDKNNRELPWYDSTKEKFYDLNMYKAKFDVRKVYTALKLLPADANVCAGENIVPHIAFRKNVSIFPYVRDADYIFIVFNSSTYPLTLDQFYVKVSEYKYNKSWKVFYDVYPVLILKRKT